MEDDESIVEVLTTILVEQNYIVDVATDGETGWELVEAAPYDLVLLDVELPKLDGISFCRRLREQKHQVLVILLTARDTTTDKLVGLDSGADDYVVKPFNAQELAARIRAVLRRGSAVASPVLQCGKLSLDPTTREVTYSGQGLRFSRKEYLILELFLRNQHRVFSRGAIIDQLWSFGEDPPDEDTVKSHIKNIRRELKAVGIGDLIETLYGQGYRINPVHLIETPATDASVPVQQQAMDSAVAAIWERMKAVSFERVTMLEQVAQSMRLGNLSEELCQKAMQSAHKLAGSLGTFGFEEGSRLAQQIEFLLQSELMPLRAIAPLLSEKVVHQVGRLVTALRQELTEAESNRSKSAKFALDAPPASLQEQPLLLIVDSDRELAESIVAESSTWKIRVAIALDLQTARSKIRTQRPDVVLLDTTLTDETEDGQTLLTQLTTDDPPIPVLVFSAQDRSADRVTAAKLGGQMFVQKPTTPSQVLQAVAEVLQQSNPIDAKMLAVDDDPQTLAALKALLEPQGIQLTCLEDPTQFWETLKSIQPDLLILDINMPGLNGLDLCQSVRRDFQWNWLPIVFLTVRTDAEALQLVFAAGADDYVPKPIAPTELSIRILNRLKRSRLLRVQAETDILTGVANRQQATQALNQLLQLATHSHQPVCLAVLDLDHFKQVNDQYGHIQGDCVLRQFGQFLKQKFRTGDVVARWGGEEFVVGVYGISREDGVERLAEILEEWRSLALLTSNDDPLAVNFSAGIAQYPIDGTNLQMLYRSADAALYRAKMAGRDRVFSAGWQPLSSAIVSTVDVLLIHADDRFAHATLRALETRGYSTHWLQSGRTALECLRGKPPKLQAQSIIVTDTLPDLDGLSVLKRLGIKFLKQTRTIVLLSHPDLAEQAQALGAFDYILAPCTVSVIMQRLRQVLRI